MTFLGPGLGIGFGILASIILGPLLLFYGFPKYMVTLVMKYRRYAAGMKVKYVKDGNFVYCYGEKNEQQPDKTSVVLIHGFTASKDMYLDVFKLLPSDLHLIAVDLPGHGETSVPAPEVEPDINFGVEKLNTFLDLIGFSDRKVHLIGASLGGATVAVFSAYHPERVEKVTMICPAMGGPIEREFMAQMKKCGTVEKSTLSNEDCPLLPNDVEGIKKMFDMCVHNPIADKIHDQFWKGILEQRLIQNEFLLRLFRNLVQPEYLNIVTSLASKITMPSQIVWGEEDQLFHVSAADYLFSKLPNCRHVDIIERAGHAISMDRPGGYCKALSRFIKEDLSQCTGDVQSSQNNIKSRI